MTKTNLLQISAHMLNSDEMNGILGGNGVPCHPSNCKSDVHISVTNGLNNLVINNPAESKKE